ncbi:hypothetical protein GOP47_0024766 [Adiantum capillus-veneris]|uniref:Laccase n=1 Tax=Adiantum capillus-veneris TaxID=13818 RepID=A0A9D4U513_ADICA|nr:hypothetical protein GOP47_0024766 [Adiantum capillus-veneris]
MEPLRRFAPIFVTLVVMQSFPSEAVTTRFYNFNVELANVTKLCQKKAIVTVNGLYPGPTVYAQEGDRVIVKVTNLVAHNVSLHWHGVRQVLSCWFDGPAYVTQCPIQAGESFTYEFTLHEQKGTLWWHAHVHWLRATVHGAMVIYPTTGTPYPFPFPHAEHVIILGEFWLKDAVSIEASTMRSGGGPPSPDAFVLNGHPGSSYPCSAQDMFSVMDVIPGRTYLLRLINAALNNEHFFILAKHKLTVVEADGEYTLPYTTDAVVITPGQTLNVLVTANQPPADYLMGMTAYASNPNIPVLTIPALALWRYEQIMPEHIETGGILLHRPLFPLNNDTAFVSNFSQNIRSFPTVYNHVKVPHNIDRNLFFTIGLNEETCDTDHASQCKGPNGGRFSASINNITFQLPHTVSLLQAYHCGTKKDSIPIFTTNFPDKPVEKFDFVSAAPNDPPNNTQSLVGTRVNVIEFGANVQIVLQNTGIIGSENHPIHLHGYSFYVVGMGEGDYNPFTATLNLRDPPLRNTIGVPAGGWAVIRFKADNPGVWYLHCHLEIHTSWGLAMAFIVENGVGSLQTLPPPPADLPHC